MDVSRIIPELSRSPPGFHAFTDSDSVSGFLEMGWGNSVKAC